MTGNLVVVEAATWEGWCIGFVIQWQWCTRLAQFRRNIQGRGSGLNSRVRNACGRRSGCGGIWSERLGCSWRSLKIKEMYEGRVIDKVME